ncbi:hypothetical protein LPJ61_000211 [Coemansia biformis]|uniref:Uncharacterized protein n=1 Tax=Coemansia biformis TaxID=1286918 RepID=A0A9W7YHI9_9FUNG|nr:hypothetical protein LPJ61_000211 [Coemansia biformis]
MAGEKRMVGRAASADALPPDPAASATHTTFLHLRLEPFISSSLIEILDVLVHSGTFAASVPSTPPPRYEPPPPSYSPQAIHRALAMVSDDQETPAVSIYAESDDDSISILTIDSRVYSSSGIDHRDTAGSGTSSNTSLCTFSGGGSSSSLYAFGIGSGSWAPMLQSELTLNVIVYEFLTHRRALSRSPSRDSAMTTTGLS